MDFNENYKEGDEYFEERYNVMSFKNFNLCNELLNNLKIAQFENPSPVQIKAIPKVLLGRDILCQAKSGTGKTAVFVLGTLERLHRNAKLKVAVCVHNNDLAEQIFSEYLRFSKEQPVKIENINSSYNFDYKANILIGTPQRILEVKKKYNIDFDIYVVDECDFIVSDFKMRKTLISLVKKKNKNVLMFTATLTKKTKALCLSLLNNPFEIYVHNDSELTLHGLKQFYIESIEMSDSKKIEIIRNIVKHYNKQTIIFCERSETARLLDRKLDDLCVSIGEFSTSNERLGIVKNFKEKQFKVLSTVDILSRGIDIQNVEIVINYELPVNPETYLHRVGRAGRFESDGYAFSFINNQNDIIRLNDIVYRHEIDIKEYKP